MGWGEHTHTHGFTLLSVTDGMFLVLREANRKVSTWRCCMNSAVFLRTAEARCYLGRGSLLCSGQGCRSCRRCRRATGPPSSRTWARLVPTSPRWTLGHTHKRTHTHIVRYSSDALKRQNTTNDRQLQEELLIATYKTSKYTSMSGLL